jgi:hypothetical protein
VDTPWERRKELGLWQGLLQTWKRTILEPEVFFRTIKPNGPWGDAVGYAWLLYAVAGIVSHLFSLLGRERTMEELDIIRDRASNLPPQLQAWVEPLLRQTAHGFGTPSLVGTLLLAPLTLIIGAGLVHIICMVMGAGKNGYYATLRALCYASAPAVFQGLAGLGAVSPAFSMLSALVSVWIVILFIFSLSSLQEISQGKAALIVLLPVLATLCCCCAGLMAAAGLAMKVFTTNLH